MNALHVTVLVRVLYTAMTSRMASSLILVVALGATLAIVLTWHDTDCNLAEPTCWQQQSACLS